MVVMTLYSLHMVFFMEMVLFVLVDFAQYLFQCVCNHHRRTGVERVTVVGVTASYFNHEDHHSVCHDAYALGFPRAYI